MEIWHVIALIFAILFGVVVLRVTLSFDLNRWLETRRTHQEERLKALCPHSYISLTANDDIVIRSHFSSPVGTVYSMCNQCGLWVLDSSLPKRILQEWATNPEGLVERQKKFHKLARKLRKI